MVIEAKSVFKFSFFFMYNTFLILPMKRVYYKVFPSSPISSFLLFIHDKDSNKKRGGYPLLYGVAYRTNETKGWLLFLLLQLNRRHEQDYEAYVFLA